jgi:23S rRNA pseudouridine2457 synthase
VLWRCEQQAFTKLPSCFRYLLFNKPFQVLSQFKSEGRRTLSDYITVPDVYPAGRLDFDSEGLLLLTDDGALQHRLTDPRYGHPRTYYVQVEGALTEEAAVKLERGLVIGGYRTRPCQARLLPEPDVWPRDPPIRFRRSIPTSWLELTLIEGRNRQVRHMTAAVGFPTLRLIRAAIGSLTIEGLPPGSFRNLTPSEIADLKRTQIRP